MSRLLSTASERKSLLLLCTDLSYLCEHRASLDPSFLKRLKHFSAEFLQFVRSWQLTNRGFNLPQSKHRKQFGAFDLNYCWVLPDELTFHQFFIC